VLPWVLVRINCWASPWGVLPQGFVDVSDILIAWWG
jgi:hypothetical protein